MRLATLTLTLLTAAMSATAIPLPEGTSVRADSMSFDPGWHAGTIKRGGGCTMVHYKEIMPGGYTSSALIALDKLQVAKGNTWEDVDLQALLAQEPEECREEMAD
jgi:hypothetical protein